jgi:predicted  nucleic acid-binding Zn-ribbon protein
MKDIIVKLLPIILVSILFLYKEDTIEFSHTILGRFLAVSIILFYISCNILYGLLACLLVILYYQFDFVESRSNLKINMIDLEGFQEGADPVDNTMQQIDTKIDTKIDAKVSDIKTDITNLKNDIKVFKTDITDLKTDVSNAKVGDIKTDITNLKNDIKGFKTDITDFKTDVSNVKADINTVKTDISTVKTDVTNNSTDILKLMNTAPKKEKSGFTNYNYDESKKTPDTRNQIKTYFKNQNCKKGELKFKNITVKNEIAPHIFPELKYENEPCNPCSDTCNFSIIEEKIKNEDALMKPVNSNDVVLKPRIPESNTIPAIGVVSEPFSTYK